MLWTKYGPSLCHPVINYTKTTIEGATQESQHITTPNIAIISFVNFSILSKILRFYAIDDFEVNQDMKQQQVKILTTISL